MICLHNEPMKNHTTLRTGGPARFLVQPETREDILETLERCRRENQPYLILGNGSNLCVSDAGFDGTVIDLSRNWNRFSIEKRDGRIAVSAQSGVMLGKLGNALAARAAAGFEFACGIPGTLGGAIAMNAGAYGREIKDCLCWAEVLDPESGAVTTYETEALNMGYRTSLVAGKKLLVLCAGLIFEAGSEAQIRADMKELAEKRKEKQPLEYPSAGSTFKRPAGHFAGKLIEDAGLKGARVGGMQVSSKHAGFIVNTGGGTACDFMALIRLVQEKVFEQAGVWLELEVKTVGFHEEEMEAKNESGDCDRAVGCRKNDSTETSGR